MASSSALNPVVVWHQELLTAPSMRVAPISLRDCRPWILTKNNLTRPDGKFFSVVKRGDFFIDQPEIGVLGFLIIAAADRPYILLQAKDEPGNVGLTQIAPTVQATLSNYSQAHGGLPTRYFDLVYPELTAGVIVSDSLQSEHGHRFWKKRNRNVTVISQEVPAVFNRFQLVSLDDLLEALSIAYLINTDARSVLVCSRWANMLCGSRQPFGRNISDWGKRLQTSYSEEPVQLEDALQALGEFRQLDSDRTEPSLEEMPKYAESLSVIAASPTVESSRSIRFFQVTSPTREVSQWAQPLYAEERDDAQILLAHAREQSLVFLLRVSDEPGLKSGCEFGATTTRELRSLAAAREGDSEFIGNQIESWIQNSQAVRSVKQSDEGGRFYRAVCEYQIRLISDESSPLSEDALRNAGYVWVNLSTLQELVTRDEVTTNELRSAVSLLLVDL